MFHYQKNVTCITIFSNITKYVNNFLKDGKLKRNVFFWFALLSVVAVFGLNSCQTTKAIDTGQDSAKLNGKGVYVGLIPSASGMGINVQLTLNDNGTFALQYRYIGKPDEVVAREGAFTLDKTKNIIKLNIENFPPYYRLGKNVLFQLDMEGKDITGDLADKYILKKQL